MLVFIDKINPYNENHNVIYNTISQFKRLCCMRLSAGAISISATTWVAKLSTIFSRENTWQEITSNHKKAQSPLPCSKRRDREGSKAGKPLQLRLCVEWEGERAPAKPLMERSGLAQHRGQMCYPKRGSAGQNTGAFSPRNCSQQH